MKESKIKTPIDGERQKHACEPKNHGQNRAERTQTITGMRARVWTSSPQTKTGTVISKKRSIIAMTIPEGVMSIVTQQRSEQIVCFEVMMAMDQTQVGIETPANRETTKTAHTQT